MSRAYYCPLCSERFEHEEVENKVKVYCSNCCQDHFVSELDDDCDEDY